MSPLKKVIAKCNVTMFSIEGQAAVKCFICDTKPGKYSMYIYIYIYIYCGGKSKRQTQWAWRQASERFLFKRYNNKIKSPKGEKCPK